MQQSWQHAAEKLIALHQQGNTQQAITQGLALIKKNPTHAFLSYLIGAFYGEIGQPEKGLTHAQHAIKLSPNTAIYHYSLGVLHGKLSQIQPAIAAYQAALQYDPNMPDALNNLGVLYYDNGDPQQAIACYQRALKCDPNKVDAYNNLGNVYKNQRLFPQAEQCYKKALQLNPNYANAYCNLGVLHYRMGDYQQAVHILKKAQQLAPTIPEIYHNLAACLVLTGQHVESEQALIKEFELTQNPIKKLQGLNAIAIHQHDYVAAKKHCHKLCQLAPHAAIGYLTYGTLLTQMNEFEAAIKQFRKAIQCEPNHADAHFSLALALLTTGRFTQGWHEFAWHWKKPEQDTIVRQYSKPLWDGTPIPDKTLLIYTEQGIGDSLQFLRFLADIKPLIGKLLIECEPVLIDIIKRSVSIDGIVSKADKTLPEYDMRLPLMGLGDILKLHNDNITRAVPYLTVDPDKQQHWQTTFAKHPRKKHIGLVWAGNPQYSNDHNRSLPYHYLQPLLQQTHCQFYSLLKLLLIREPYVLPKDAPIVNLSPQLHTFDDTAAIIAALDLVISVDTATAHLAGALGKPVWILLPFSADWRWGIQHNHSRWYPSARLFRQSQPGDWQTVIHAINKELLID